MKKSQRHHMRALVCLTLMLAITARAQVAAPFDANEETLTVLVNRVTEIESNLGFELPELHGFKIEIREKLNQIQGNATEKSEELDEIKRDVDNLHNMILQFQLNSEEGLDVTSCDPYTAFIADIPDSSLTASSFWNINHGPQRSRLNTLVSGAFTGAWSSGANTVGQYIEADLGTVRMLAVIATRGRNEQLYPQWVTSYQFAYSVTGPPYEFISNEDGSETSFVGNSDSDTIVEHEIEPILARYVRLHPKTWQSHISMRWEVYGCALAQQLSAISAQEVLINQQQAVIAQLGTDLQNLPNAFGVTYVRWGRTVCPSTADLVYEGYAGKSAYNHGGGDNYQCLVKDPSSPTGSQAGYQRQSYMYGAVYQMERGNVWDSVALNAAVPCAVCQIVRRTRILMIPGKQTCPTGWTREYFGVLAAERYNHHSGSTFECVDVNPEEVPESRTNNDGGIMYPVETVCGALKCPPYVDGNEISCAVCTA